MRLAVRVLALLMILLVPATGAFAETDTKNDTKVEDKRPDAEKPAAGEKEKPAAAKDKPAAEKDKDKANAKERPFSIVVLGDSLADGLWASVYRAYIRSQKQVAVKRYAVNSAGFTAHSFEGDFEKIAKEQPIDLVIFMVGATDRQRAFAQGTPREWAQFRTEKWHNIYRQNIQRFLGLIQEKKVSLVWVGLPVMRKEDANEDAKMMNGIYREVAATHGALFVDITAATSNKEGEYDPYLEDDKGRKRRFRADDGVHFTDFGYDHVVRHVWKVAREKLPQFQTLWSIPGP